MQFEEDIIQYNKDIFECIIVQKIIDDDAYLSCVIEYLNISYFKEESCKFFVGIITRFYQKYTRKPSLSELKTINDNDKVKKYIDRIQSKLHGININDISDDILYNETQTFLRQQAVINTLWDVADKLENNKLKEDNVYHLFEKACSIHLSIDLGLDIYENIEPYLKELERTDRHISTGFKWLDEKLNGGFLESGKALYLYVGETNVGKSIFLSNTATTCLKQNKKVLVISLEMPEILYTNRIISSGLNFPVNGLVNYKDDIREKFNEFKYKNPDSRLLIKEFPPNTISCSQLKSYIQQVCNKKFTPDIIILDYINLLAPSQGNNSYERIKYIAEQVRAMTYTFKCPIITASQLNRQGFSASITPGLEYISESIALAATADGIMPIWRTDEDKEEDTIHLGITKSRAGKNEGITRLKCDYSTLSLYEDETLNATDHIDESESSAFGFANN